MKRTRSAVLAALLTIAGVTQAIGQSTMPANTVWGRLGVSSGPASAIPLSTLANIVGGLTIGSTTITGGTDKGVLYNNAGVVGNATALSIQTESSYQFVGVGDNVAAGILVWGGTKMPLVLADRTVNWAQINDNTFVDFTVLTATSNAGIGNQYASFNARTVTANTAFNWNHIVGFEEQNVYIGSGTLTNSWGYFTNPTISGPVTNRMHYYANESGGAGAITTQYGYYAAAMTRGSTNYAFYSAGTTPSYFGGIVTGNISATFGPGVDLQPGITNKVQVTNTGGTLEFIVGQDTTHNLQMYWQANSPASSAISGIATAGYNNPLAIDASAVTINTTSGGTTTTGALVSAAHTVTSTSANALAVGRQGATNPVLQIDASTASVATGLKVKGAAAAGGMALSVITSGTNENLTIDAAGSGTITIGGTSTGSISMPRAVSSLAHTITSASANALAVGLNGATNPAFNVDASTASSATGLNVKSAAAAGGLAVSVISSGSNENLTLDAKGSGTITVGGTSTGAITLTRATTASVSVTTPLIIGGTGTGSSLRLQSTSGAGSTDFVAIETASQSEKARVTNAGDLLVGLTSAPSLGDSGNGVRLAVQGASTTYGYVQLLSATTGAQEMGRFSFGSSAYSGGDKRTAVLLSSAETGATTIPFGSLTIFTNNGTNLTQALSINSSQTVIVANKLRTGVTTVGSLGTCAAGNKGDRWFVSDANATTFASTVAGGGANNVPVVCNGTNWIIGSNDKFPANDNMRKYAEAPDYRRAA